MTDRRGPEDVCRYRDVRQAHSPRQCHVHSEAEKKAQSAVGSSALENVASTCRRAYGRLSVPLACGKAPGKATGDLRECSPSHQLNRKREANQTNEQIKATRLSRGGLRWSFYVEAARGEEADGTRQTAVACASTKIHARDWILFSFFCDTFSLGFLSK